MSGDKAEAKARAKARRRELDVIQERIEREDPYRPVWLLALMAVASFLQAVISFPLAVVIFVFSGIAALIARDEDTFDRGATLATNLVYRPWMAFLMVGGVAVSLPVNRIGRAFRRKFNKS